MSVCRNGRAIPNRKVEPAIVALQEAANNAGQSDTIRGTSLLGDSTSRGAAQKEVREARGIIRTWKMLAGENRKY